MAFVRGNVVFMQTNMNNILFLGDFNSGMLENYLNTFYNVYDNFQKICFERTEYES